MPSFSQTLPLKEAFETAAQLNEEVKWIERFAKNPNFYSIDFLYFFAKRRIKLVEKMTNRKKNRGHRTSKIVKSTQSYSNGHYGNDHLPHCSLYYLARMLDARHDVWILCTVRICRRTSAKSLKWTKWDIPNSHLYMLQVKIKIQVKLILTSLILNFLDCLTTLIIHNQWISRVKRQRNLILTCNIYNKSFRKVLSLVCICIPHRSVHDRNVELPAPGHSD